LGQIRAGITFDGFAKSSFAALRFTFVIAAYLVSTSHSPGFARLAPGAFYFAIPILTFNAIDFRHQTGRERGDIRMATIQIADGLFY
jgi:hypothetical protein